MGGVKLSKPLALRLKRVAERVESMPDSTLSVTLPPDLYRRYSILFRNESPQTCPAFGAMIVTGIESADDNNVIIYKANIPDDSVDGHVILNGPVPVETMGYGTVQTGEYVSAIYDGSPPTTNTRLGIIDGQFYLGDDSLFLSHSAVKDYDAVNKLMIVRRDYQSVASILFQAPVGGISARTGQTPGVASCSIVDLVDGDYETTGQTVNVYNWAVSAVCVTGDRYGVAETVAGVYHVSATDCSDV